MKPNLFAALGGFVLLLLAGAGCQKEEALKPFLDQKISVRSHDCLAECIDPDDPTTYPDAGEIVQIVGNPSNNNYRRVDFEAYNTLTDFEVNWTYSATAGGNRTVIVTVNSGPATLGSIQSNNGPTPSTDTFVFSLEDGWAACDEINFTVSIANGEDDVQATGDFTYALVGQCVEECEESFSYTDNENGTYTFSYTSAEDVEDAHLVFTFPQAEVVSGLDDWTKHGVTYHNVQDLTACTVYTWTVGLECSGKQGTRNLWTDFKVNDVSKKNENTPNIVGECNQ